ncbi:MAG: T9SS type A sorting domain-containing protein [Flavobacteriales bacterium]|nr:T9SS type A sorting domain-containing protein [Flavobacteriales bacterium]
MKHLYLFFLTALISLNSSAQKTHQQKALNSRSDTIDVLNYQINLDMTNVGNQQISGHCVVKFTPKMNGISNINLDLLNLTVDSVKSLGTLLSYTHNDTLIKITLPAALNTTDTSTVTVYYGGSPQMDPSGWGGFYFSGQYAFNLGVGFDDDPHNYGRVWFPCFDNFVERSTYEFNITTGGGKKAHCNGLLTNEAIITGDTITRTWVMNDEIPTYLACVAVAPYETVHWNFNGMLGNIPVELAALAGDTTNMKNSFVNLNGALDAYEQHYGPYVWDKIGYSLVPFSSGAMEHATNIAYPVLTANGNLTYETLMAHEFSHHWWGDLVTCETAGDMWINEGMATYSEHLFLENIYDYATSLDEIKANHKDVIQFTHLNEGGYRAVSGIPHEYTYGEHVYNKGASVAHNMRAYMGDSLFFTGLKSITTNYQFKTINSAQFRDELTNSTGVDMTNFFNDWIFAPGFSHFDIDSLTSVPNGPNHDVTVYVRQKLRGASNFHTGTPLLITFYDNSWNSYLDTLVASGEFSNSTITVPFNPAFAILNESNKLNQARTDDKVIIKNPVSNVNFSLSMVKSLNVTNVSDSSFIMFEHHWVAPDSIKNNPLNHRISSSRYWSVDGILSPGFSGNFRLEFDGRASKGYLDFDLVPVNGDSIILLYRPDPSYDWQVYPYYTKTLISQTLAYGWVTVDSIMLGEYTFANSAIAIGVNEEVEQAASQFNVYPNPAHDDLTIENLQSATAQVEIYDLQGKLIEQFSFQKKLKVNTGNWKRGNYILVLRDGTNTPEIKKVILQ